MENIAAMGIGGTNFTFALGTPSGELLTQIHTIDTDLHRIDEQVLTAIERLQSAGRVDAVSIACKGLVDPDTGRIEGMNRPDGSMAPPTDIGTAVENTFDLPLCLENDGQSAALAEHRLGVGKKADTTVHITMGTGIGGGVVERDRLIRGTDNFAAEFGSIIVESSQDPDRCTTWESVCSGPGILSYTIDHLSNEDEETSLHEPEELSPEDVFAHAEAGDRVAQQYLKQIGRYNAIGCATVSNLFNPDVIALGGGVALNNFETIKAGIERSLAEHCIHEPPAIERSRLGADIGVYGALVQFEDWSSASTSRSTPKSSPQEVAQTEVPHD